MLLISKKKRTFCFLAVISILMIGCHVLDAAAASKYYLNEEVLWEGNDASVSSPHGNFPEDKISILSVKSSKPKVIKIERRRTSHNDISSYTLLPLKAGKSKITVKFKYKKKTYSASGNFTVKKYVCPFQWIKIDGKKIPLAKNKYSYYTSNGNKKKSTVTIKLKKGWKVNNWEGIDFKNFSNFTVKNGKAFSVGTEGVHVGVSVTNGTDDFFYYVQIARNDI